MARPIRAVMPTLDGQILEVLSRTTRPLTGAEIHRIAGTGSENGIRKALARLSAQGVVTADERGRAIFYVGNREHLAWPAVELLSALRAGLLDRLRHELMSWSPAPVHASLFGSAARGDGDATSDIDVLLVRPDGIDEDESPWADQVDRLRDLVRRWTGNHCQTFQLDRDRLAEHVRADDPLVDGWKRDGIHMAGSSLAEQLRQLPDRSGRG